MWHIKFIKFVPTTQAGGDYHPYYLQRNDESGEVYVTYHGRSLFGSEGEAKSYLQTQFHRDLNLEEISGWVPHGLANTQALHAETKRIRYMSQLHSPHVGIHYYTLKKCLNTGIVSVEIRKYGQTVFESEDEANSYLLNHFHNGLVLKVVSDWRTAPAANIQVQDSQS